MPQPLRYNPASDYYKVLGVQPTATNEEITRVFRQRAKEVHPDVNPHRREWAHQEFQRINTAYEVLSNPELRIQYDKQRFIFLTRAFEAPVPKTVRRRRRGPMWVSYIGAIILCVSLSAIPFLLHGSSINYRPNYVRNLDFLTDENLNLPEVGNPQGFLTRESLQASHCNDPDVQITQPTNGAVVKHGYAQTIYGTASGQGFESYDLVLDMFDISTKIDLVNDFRRPVKQGLLNTDALIQFWPNSTYGLYLTVHYKNGTSKQCNIQFTTGSTGK